MSTKGGYVEILEFTHFVSFFSFDYKKEMRGNKQFVNQITVVIALDLGCGDTMSYK